MNSNANQPETFWKNMPESLQTYDILFFIKGIPLQLKCSSDHWAVATVSGSAVSIVKGLSDGNLRFKYFVEAKSEDPLLAFVYRGTADILQSAIGQAYDQLELLLDGYSLMTDSPAEASKIVLARQVPEDDLGIYEYYRGGYGTSKKDPTTGDGQWHARNHLLLRQVVKHLGFTSGVLDAPIGEIRRELTYALRMYRQGTESVFQGIEFLAKFSALECLVCGSITSGKESLLVQRLGELYDGESFFSEDLIKRLWRLRCLGSHQARVSTQRKSRELMPPGLAAIEIDRIFAGVLYFLLENIDLCNTLEELWNLAREYTLPELICMHRPKGVTRMPVTEFLLNFNSQIIGAGELFDKLHLQLKKKF